MNSPPAATDCRDDEMRNAAREAGRKGLEILLSEAWLPDGTITDDGVDKAAAPGETTGANTTPADPDASGPQLAAAPTDDNTHKAADMTPARPAGAIPIPSTVGPQVALVLDKSAVLTVGTKAVVFSVKLSASMAEARLTN